MRLHVTNVGTPTGKTNPITIESATASTCSWETAPENVPLIAAPDYMAITATPTTATEERFWLVGYVPGSTSGLIQRLPFDETGTRPQTLAAHESKPWVHAPTRQDFRTPAARDFASINFR